MKTALIVVFITFALSIGAWAQHQTRLEVVGGYSLDDNVPCGTGCRGGGAFPPTIFNGWDASLTGYFYKSAGVTADFSGNYSGHIVYDPVVGAHRYSYLFGPTYAFRGEIGSVFIHTLFGEISQGSDQLSNLNFKKFAWRVGCGLDANLSRRFALRVLQFDYERTRVPTFGTGSETEESVHGFRYSAGVVVKF